MNPVSIVRSRIASLRTVAPSARGVLRTPIVVACVLGAAAGVGLHAYAQDGSREQPLLYAGTVANQDGTPLDGTHDVRVRFFAQEKAGAALCETPPLSVPFTLGRFRVELPGGQGGCSDALASAEVWTEVSVDGNTFPRARIGAVPFAVRAKHATTADVLTGEQAKTLERVTAKVDAPPAAVAPTLSYRFISKETGECGYSAATNATTCKCKPGELILSGGAWAGAGGVLNATRIWNRPGDGFDDAARGLAWTVTCIDVSGAARECEDVQALCMKTTL